MIGSMLLATAGCGGRAPATPVDRSPFADDLAFLRQHTDIVVLRDEAGDGQVVVAPAYQGRVMTSTTGGEAAPSFGWLGRAAIASGERQPHMNAFGGEDRFWLGPEGGQFALYFAPQDPFDLDHWQVPAAFDWGAWEVANQSPSSAQFHKRMSLENYSRTTFEIDVDRTVRVLGAADVARHLGVAPASGVRAVAFESNNTVTNAGGAAWRTDTGQVSIWILGMFNPSKDTTIAIPFVPGDASALGPVVNDTYFGKVPADRLAADEGVLFFRGDGLYRSKIGLPPPRALPMAGSYDASNHVLTIVQHTRPADASAYVNSMWEIQKEPFKGDVINSYNDGPPAPGKPPLGPFYEIETSSPALGLEPGGRFTHTHRTFHLVGEEADLDRVAREALHVPLAKIARAFDGPTAR
ncbi:MAG: DUF6786 family protein [Vicinamibacterales bacterium]